MKERPILFNGEMVRAVLEGRKIQTRRLVPDWQLPHKTYDSEEYISTAHRHHRYGFGVLGKTEDECMANYKSDYASCCPFGEVGDRLWVRETFQGPLLNIEQAEECYEHGPEKWHRPEFCAYRATDKHPNAVNYDGDDVGWTPSIHMPRWASRITLEITGVRVERLNEISEEDAKAEGVIGEKYIGQGFDECLNRVAFCTLWDSIYGTWEQNPWVWVIEFKVIDDLK